MLYNWSCHYTRDNLHLDLHHLAMMFLIQRSIYTLKEISLENNELIYHTVCSCVEHLSYWDPIGLLHISDLALSFLPINTSIPTLRIPLIGLPNTSKCLKHILQWLTKNWFIWPMNYVSQWELCIIVGMASNVSFIS